MEKEIIKAFKKQKNNSVPVLAKQFKMKENAIHRVINKYLQPKSK